MADIKLESFKGRFKDGARPNRFFVKIEGQQAGANWVEGISFFVKTFSLPPKTVGEIIVNYQGMQTKIAGDPTFDDMAMTLHNDYELTAKKYFEQWLEGFITIGTDGTNTRLAPADYKAEIIVEQLGRTGETLATYKVVGAYPKQMDAIELSHESVDTIEELSISFGIDYWYQV
jgi:T4-like virus tail tube protein gp19